MSEEIIFYQIGGEKLPFDKREDAFYWRAGRRWGVRSFTSPEELEAILKQLKPKFLVLQELSPLEKEWNTIWRRALVFSTHENVGQLTNGFEGWHLTPLQRPIAPIRETWALLARSMNNELIFSLAKKLLPDLLQAIDAVELEATEKYTFIAHVKDFQTEISSLLLYNRLKSLKQLKQELLNSLANPRLEKEIASLRQELFENERSLWLILQNIVQSKALTGSLQKKCELLFYAIVLPAQPRRSWIDLQLIWHLLFTHMEIISIAISPWNEKTAWLVALQESLDQYIERQGGESIFAYLRKETSVLPEELRADVRTQLAQFHALPEPPFESYNAELASLIS